MQAPGIWDADVLHAKVWHSICHISENKSMMLCCMTK